MRELGKQEILDILTGCAVLGTGGGGNLSNGIELMEDDFSNNRILKMMSVDELEDSDFIGTPYECGAPKTEDMKEDEYFKKLPHIKESPSMLAFKRLEKYLGTKFTAVSTTELGGANTAEALHIACMLNLPVMDADPAGRSVPELQHSTYYIKDIPLCPASVSTNFGETMILENACNDFRAEDIIRAVAVASDNEVGVVDHPMTGKQYKESVIVGALTMAETIGKIIRISAGDGGKKVAEKIADTYEGKYLFSGNLSEYPWKMEGGFNIGKMVLKGKDEFEGNQLVIEFKNETMIAFLDGEPVVMIPDLICLLDENGHPFNIPNFGDGMEINVFALPAHEYWKTEKGLSIFSPKVMGYDVEYKPL